MRTLLTWLCAVIAPLAIWAEEKTVVSPDGKLCVTVAVEEGRAFYTVAYDGHEVMGRSALGLRTNLGDFTKNLTWQEAKEGNKVKDYQMTRTKKSQIHYDANTLAVTLQTEKKVPLTVEFWVSDNNIAFRYLLGRGPKDNPKCAIVESEATAFNLPEETRSFICPQITPMKGWERTKPSYEEEYKPDEPVNIKSQFGVGYTFPCLFRQEVDGMTQETKGKKLAANYSVRLALPVTIVGHVFPTMHRALAILLPIRRKGRTTALAQREQPSCCLGVRLGEPLRSAGRSNPS